MRTRLEIHKWERSGFALVRAAGTGETLRAPPFEDVELRTGVLFGDEDDEE